MSKLLSVLLGIVLGMLAATQFPLWPTTKAPLLRGWNGGYRDYDGALRRDDSVLFCPGRIGKYVLWHASAAGSLGGECKYDPPDRYERPDAGFGLSISTRVATEPWADAVSTTAGFADGPQAAWRVTRTQTRGSGPIVSDLVVVPGPNMQVVLACYESRPPLDLEACHALQDEFLSEMHSSGLGFGSDE